jgi:hypothetical protein
MGSVNGTMSAVAEHSLVKAATPFVVAALIGVTGWGFSSIMSLQQDMKLLRDGSIHNLEEKVDGLSVRIDEMNKTLTDLRVSLGGRARAGLDL